MKVVLHLDALISVDEGKSNASTVLVNEAD